MTPIIINKNIMLFDGTLVNIDLEIPVTKCIFNGDILRGEEILIDQYLSTIKSIIDAYHESLLPDKFLKYQKFIITNRLPQSVGGIFLGVNDDIYFDADHINIINGKFLFGHEEGHKIAKYKEDEEVYRGLANILGIGYEEDNIVLKELYADMCGNLVDGSTNPSYVLEEQLSEKQVQGMTRLVLANIYHV